MGAQATAGDTTREARHGDPTDVRGRGRKEVAGRGCLGAASGFGERPLGTRRRQQQRNRRRRHGVHTNDGRRGGGVGGVREEEKKQAVPQERADNVEGDDEDDGEENTRRSCRTDKKDSAVSSP